MIKKMIRKLKSLSDCLLLAPTAPHQFVMPFYKRVVKLDLPVEWAAVSEDAKIDYVFNMFMSPRLVKLQWDATSAKMPNHPPSSPNHHRLQYESWHDGGCVIMKTTRSYPDRSVYNTTLLTPEAAEKFYALSNQVIYIQYSAYEPKRTGPRSMTISEYNVRVRKDFPATDLDAAAIKSRSLSNMFRHVEASIVGDQVWLWLRVPMPKMPPDTKVCGPPCCCLPGCNYVAFPLFMQGMKGTVKPIYDVSMDAIEDDFRQRRLAAPLDAGGGVMTLPVFAAELPIAQVIAVVPIQMIQVVTTTTTITGDPMTGEQWVTTQQTVTTTTTTMTLTDPTASAGIAAVHPAVEAVPVVPVCAPYVPVAQAMEREHQVPVEGAGKGAEGSTWW